MKALWNYLTDPQVTPSTRTCRLKVWAHDNAFTLFYVAGFNVIGWAVTVIACHG